MDRLDLINSRYSARRKAGEPGWGDRQGYEAKAKVFDRLAEGYSLPSGAHILELGCGSGEVTLHIAQKGFAVYGIDISSEAIKWAEENARKRRLQANFAQGTVTELNRFSENFFDMVLDGDCLWMILGDDRPAAFKAIFRVLRPGGILYAQAHLLKQDYNAQNNGILGVEFDPDHRISTVQGVPMYQFSTEQSFRQEIEAAGLKVTCTGMIEVPTPDEMPFAGGEFYIEARKQKEPTY